MSASDKGGNQHLLAEAHLPHSLNALQNTLLSYNHIHQSLIPACLHPSLACVNQRLHRHVDTGLRHLG